MRKDVPDQSFALSLYQQSPGCQARKLSMHLPKICTVMIREKAIFIKLNQLHFSDQQLFDMAVSGFDPDKCPCPKCKAVGRFKQIRSYKRDMISVSGNERIDTVLSVPRFLCESCGHSHALLPDILIPFGSYSLRFVLTVLLGYLNRSCPVAAFCEHWQIAISTLYGWIHLFTEQYNAWCKIMDRILWVCRDAICSVSSAPAFPSSFFLRFGFSFLQRHQTSPSGLPPLPDRRRRPCSA